MLRGWGQGVRFTYLPSQAASSLALLLLIAAFITPAVVSIASGSNSEALGRGPRPRSREQHPLHHFSAEQLEAPTAPVLRRLEDAVFNVGMFVVTDFELDPWSSFGPSGPEDALAEFTLCAQQGHLYSQLNEVVLADGSIRSTLAAKTSSGTASPLPAATANCPRFVTAAGQLRAAVDRTGQAYARLLDALLYGPGRTPATPGRASSSASGGLATAAAGGEEGSKTVHEAEDSAAASLEEGPIGLAVQESESLEHFHLFHQHSPHSPRPALEMHSDMGLFIVMTAAEFFSSDTAGRLDSVDSGLRLELPDGRIVTPSVPPGSLLVMNGEGISRWMPAGRAGRQPHAPSHEVELPDGQGVVRAWFGRMYLPPSRAVLQQPAAEHGELRGAAAAPLTFGEYRAQAMSAFRRQRGQEASAVGCSPGRAHKLEDEGSCGADEIFCWMVCMSTSHLDCGAAAVCRNPAGLVWPQDFVDPDTGQTEHCADCTAQCTDQDDAPDAPSGVELCNTNLTAISMFMQGFQTTSRHHGPCLVFLFQQLPLTTWLRFVLACAGTFFMGVCSGGLSWASRMAARCTPTKLPNTSRARLSAEALQAAVYAVRISLAYILMLIAMSYQVELFVAVIAGLVVGHWGFNIRSDEEEDIVDPCCC